MSTAPKTGERRKRDRRTRARKPSDGSWFGALSGVESPFADETLDASESRLEGGWPHHPQAADSQFLSRQARRFASAEQTAFDRIYRVFLAARSAVGVAILLAMGTASLFGVRPSLLAICLSTFYSTLAIGLWLLPRFRKPAQPRQLARIASPQWIATIGADIACFTALHLLSSSLGSTSFNYAALLVIPVLMAGVLTPRRHALATAAAAAIALLGTGWFASGGAELAAALTQAGLAGSGLFVITVLAGELAGRLAREELTAKGSLELARQQAQLNRLVIEEMQDGVLVVDRRGRVRTANPAARLLLAPEGMARPAPFQLRGVEAWEALVKTVERAFIDGEWPEAGRDVMLEFDPSQIRVLRVRIRFARRRDAQADSGSGEEFCVLLLEDVRNMQQRTRQEKLAAMGRVSAGIAHEIRNPLAAIAQANALLSEDAESPAQRQLTRMVSDNVERLKRIVDDVMEVAPGRVHTAGVFDLCTEVTTVCHDWAHANGMSVGEASALKVEVPTPPLYVAFDADHLRRVLVNLLDNGHRHSMQKPGSVQVRIYAMDEQTVHLSVASDGQPIPPDVERYLFEPFFSTRSRGTGLGLYICRELCERYGASIDYRLRLASEPNRNEFLVAMKREHAVAAENSAPTKI